MTTTPDTLAKLAAKAAHEAVSAIYFADSSDYLPALRSITRLLAPDLAAMLDTDEQLAWQTSDDRANGPDEIAAQALPAAEPVAFSGADETPPVFGRRWRLAVDGFGLQRDDADGNYVHIDDALSVLHQAAQQAAQATAGWVMVPVEPTAAMLAAVVTSMDEHLHGKEAEKQYREDWTAMLAARPELPQPQPDNLTSKSALKRIEVQKQPPQPQEGAP